MQQAIDFRLSPIAVFTTKNTMSVTGNTCLKYAGGMSEQTGLRGGVSGPEETVLAFVNTRDDALGRPERFGSATDFAAWARENALGGDGVISESEAAAAREMRSALVTLLLAHAAHPGRSEEKIREAEQFLAHAAELYPVKVTLMAGGASAVGQRRGAAGTLGSVLAAANAVVERGDWARLKACCSDPCEHGFYDRTKNGSQRHCSTTCASRATSRAKRGRRREGQLPATSA